MNRTSLTGVSEPPRLTEALPLWIREVGDHLAFTVTTAVRVHSTLVCSHTIIRMHTYISHDYHIVNIN